MIFQKIIFLLTAKPRFFLIARNDGRAVTGQQDGRAEMETMDRTNAHQMWVFSDYGQQVINVGTNMPLKAGQARSWVYDDNSKTLDDGRNIGSVVFNTNGGTWNKIENINLYLILQSVNADTLPGMQSM